jgi:hypothetical protein
VPVAPQDVESFGVVRRDHSGEHDLGVLDDEAVGPGLVGRSVSGCPHVRGYRLSGRVVARRQCERGIGVGYRRG